MRKRTFWGLLIVLMIGIPLVWAAFPEVRKLLLYAHANALISDENWVEAFHKLESIQKLDPDYLDLRDKLEEVVVQNVLLISHRLSLEHETHFLRWLNFHGEYEKLASTLDRCVLFIPAGWFSMGDNKGDYDERPQREIYLDPYQIDRYEVTNAQYHRFLLETGREPPTYWSSINIPAQQADFPVVGVSWEDANEYCIWVGKRLPTEAEWEKACRSNDGRRFPWGNEWHPEYANLGLEDYELWPDGFEGAWDLLLAKTTNGQNLGVCSVGRYPEGASPYGVLDMVGNVEEWVADWYDANSYRMMSRMNPYTEEPEWAHAIRGSGWVYRKGMKSWVEGFSRCSSRNSSHAYAHARVGFRCARSVQE